MMNSIHHAVPLNAILMRQDEATNESIAMWWTVLLPGLCKQLGHHH
jgi:hypothetical protein